MPILRRTVTLLLLAACGSPGDAASGAPAVQAVPTDTATAPAAPANARTAPPGFTLQPFRNGSGALDSAWVMRDGARVQTLVTAAEDLEPPPGPGADLGREDVNFDGVPDVWHLAWWGATGNAGYTWWLYDPASGEFRHSPEFSEKVGGHTLDPARRRITVRSNGGHAGLVFTEEVYEVRDGELREVGSTEQDWLPDLDRYVRRTRVRRGDGFEERVDTLRREDLPAPGSPE
ncbi:MAG TPA: hypothetical protein VHG51_03735 [Longimicrobiaceae bacterium]|nr:hypothetical protein [Longimicrobiaceae bacterium]